MADRCTAKFECDPLFHVVKNRGCTFDRSNIRKTLTDLIKRTAHCNAARGSEPGIGGADQIDRYAVGWLGVDCSIADGVNEERFQSSLWPEPFPYLPRLRHPPIYPVRLSELLQLLPTVGTKGYTSDTCPRHNRSLIRPGGGGKRAVTNR